MLEQLLVLCLVYFAQRQLQGNVSTLTCLAKPAPYHSLLAIDFVYEGRLHFGYAPSSQFLDKPVTVGGPESGFACKNAHAGKNCICK